MKTKLILLAFLTCPIICLSQRSWKITRSELLLDSPPFHQCHASSIVEIFPGRLMAVWFGGSREGAKDVCIWSSTTSSSIKKNAGWTAPTVLATGVVTDTLRYPCWNPVIFRSRSGRLLLFYKIGPSPQLWWGMMLASSDNGKTWSAPVRLPQGILGPIKNKPFQLDNGVILAPSSVETKNKWSVHIERSEDDGNTWQSVAVDTTGFDVIQPSILNYGHGRMQILCRSKQGSVVQSWSADNGKRWGRLSKTSLLNPNSGTDAVTLQDGQQMIVYNPDIPGKDWYNGRARLHVAVSVDGKSWKDVLTLENGTTEEFSYPAVIQTKDGSVHITYTYDRKNIKHVVLQKDL